MRLYYLFAAVIFLAACHHEQKTQLARNPPLPAAQTIPQTHLSDVPVSGPITTPASADVHSIKENAPVQVDRNPTVDWVNAHLQDVFYGYDRADLTDSASAALEQDAKLLPSILAQFPHLKATVEGHCDERGSAEYNLALGDTRARRASEALRELGLSTANLDTVSYGKENPQCSESSESRWQKNRRAHIAIK